MCYPDRPETPQELMAVNLTSRNFTLTWVEPHDNNAPIQGYMYVTNIFPMYYLSYQTLGVLITLREQKSIGIEHLLSSC